MAVVRQVDDYLRSVLIQLDADNENWHNQALQENVYWLATYLEIPFSRLDETAANKGYQADDPRRLAGALARAVYTHLSNGTTYWLSRQESGNDELSVRAAAVLRSSKVYPTKGLLEFGDKVRLTDQAYSIALWFLPEYKEFGRGVFAVTESGQVIYKPAYWSEHFLAESLVRILRAPMPFDAPIDATSVCRDAGLDPEQTRAVTDALKNKVTILTGPPGTGKTEVILSLVRAVLRHVPDAKIRLAAYTGMAAINLHQRLQRAEYPEIKRYLENPKNHPKTLHSLLQMAPTRAGQGKSPYSWKKGRTLDADLVIVDEFGMVDTFVARALLYSLRSETMLILVGDADQLPPIGPGNVLRDLTERLSRVAEERKIAVPVWRKLETVHRTGEGAIIPVLAKSIRQVKKGSDLSETLNLLGVAEERGEVEWLQTESDQETFEVLLDRYIVDGKTGRILTPWHQGTCGEEAFNKAIAGGKIKFFVGAPIIQNRTNYELKIVNGDTGKIVDVGHDPRKGPFVVAEFGDRHVQLPMTEANEQWILGYASTVHKAQGIEMPVIYIPLWSHNGKSVWTVPHLYTAITRARKKVVLAGSEEEFRSALRGGRMFRRTGLVWRYVRAAEK